jgi:hypothetical protein
MKVFRIMILSSMAVLLALTMAYALPNLDIDFRTAAWSANGTTTKTVGNVTAISTPGILYQDTTDGLGVVDTIQNDEINVSEKITVVFSTAVNLTGVALTDIYAFGGLEDVTNPAGEYGQVQLFNGGSSLGVFTFNGTDANNGVLNGELYRSFGGAIVGVTSAEFIVLPYNNVYRGNEYSVAGFTTSVPEPTTMLLLGFGLLGLAGVRRFRK